MPKREIADLEKFLQNWWLGGGGTRGKGANMYCFGSHKIRFSPGVTHLAYARF